MEPEVARDVVLSLLEDQALAIGGCVATHDIPDQAVWDLMQAMDAIRARALARLGEVYEDRSPVPDEIAQPHPAVEEFLRRLRQS
jgi:hypothetical protein